MKHICELHTILGEYFNWNKSRLTVLTNLLLGLFMVKTVNLFQLATVLHSKAKIDSNFKRIQRFFNWLISLNDYQEIITDLVITILSLKDKKNDLALDRTNWKFGKKHINILVLGVDFKGISIPLAWISLGKAGNSKTIERISILKRIIDKIRINSFTADREFIGSEWFKFLINSKIPSYIRVKEDTQVLSKDGKYTVGLRDLCRQIRCGKRKVFKGLYTLLGVNVHIAASRNYKGELLIVITNDCPLKALKIYKKRWAIETLFGYLKTKGFRFEDTHMTDLKKIDAWMLLLTLAVVWTLKANAVIRSKMTYASHGRKRKSVFRSCFEEMRRCLLCLEDYLDRILCYINILSKQKAVLNKV
jgi:DDE family transposase